MTDTSLILIVDDVPENLKALSGILTAEGYDVRPAPNGELALKAADALTPDLILLDVEMPGMSGFEVITALKARPKLSKIPVLFLSGRTDLESKVEGLGLGAVDYITKPFNAQEVIARVRTHLSVFELSRKIERQRDELMELEAHRDALTNMIVHDLRSPLNVLQVNGQLLADELAEVVNADQRGMIADIVDGAARLTDIVATLLDVHRMEAGELPVECIQADVTDILAGVVDRVQAISNGAELVYVQPSSAMFAELDPALSERIFENLVSNAFKYAGGGAVTLQCRAVDGWTRVEVSDEGPGIPSEWQERIFEKFAQVDASRQAGRRSTGLGLAFCKLAAEAQGARIGVESEPGHGATFWVEFPSG